MKRFPTFLFFLSLILVNVNSCRKLEKEMLVSTGTVSNITVSSADASGNIIDLGNGITEHGHCYAKSPNVTIISGTMTKLGIPTGKGGFTSQIKELEAGTIFYIKAYASDGIQTVYGNEISFSTLAPSVPLLTTSALSLVTQTTAISGGTISSDGGSSITTKGVCWSTSANPTTANFITTDGTGSGTFASNLTGLTGNTAYYVRAYATNSIGTGYGNELIFTSGPVVPLLTTASINPITATSAVSGGDITSDGGSSIISRGVCWNTSPDPTIANFTITSGSGTGNFTSNIGGLTGNTTYYVRAFATNTTGTAYGNELSFTTSPLMPTVTTTAVSLVTSVSVTSGGDVSSDGGAAITARGVCWSISNAPTISGDKTVNSAGTGSFASNITGLTGSTTYYVRAYATNSAGTAYGEEKSFTTDAPVAPTLTTTAAMNVAKTSASSGGNISSDGGAPVTDRGVCWNTSPGPTTSNFVSSSGSGSGSFTSSIGGLTLNTKYYVRAYAINNIGTSYGSEISFTTDLSTGDSYQGGIVFYILQTGDTGYDPGTRHGLISATFDLSSGTQWGCDGTLISGADGSAIGTGAANTNSIVTGCTTAGIASRLCYDLVIGIYSDWYLPSINELYKLYDNRAIIGGFNTTGVAYWSSTQSLEWSAWAQNFQMGNAGGTNKSNSTTLVRAIRSF